MSLKKNSYLPSFSLLIYLVAIILLLVMFFTEWYAFPLLLLIPLVLIWLYYDYKWLFLLLIGVLPLAVFYRFEAINLSLALPSEPLIGLLAIYTLSFLLFAKTDNKFSSSPMSKLLLVYWVLLVCSMFFSMKFIVSLKAMLVYTAYLLVFYYLAVHYLYTTKNGIRRISWVYAMSLFVVVLLSTWEHSQHGFNKNYSANTVEPFFSDHTIYGACLSLVVPVMLIFFLYASELKVIYIEKITAFFFLCTFLVAVYLSHSRATWVGLAGALVLWIVLRLKISYTSLMAIGFIGLVVVLFNIESLMPILLKNKYDSKAKRANLEEQIRSVTNIKNDVSNAERVNRWMCALRMFKEKPLTGYGVGTYQFEYIPFQKGSEMTEISVISAKNNLAQGTGGTAHSEYLLILSESGMFAFMMLVVIVFYALYLGMSTYYTSSSAEIKYYTLMTLLGLTSYFVHAVFNNFLTTDKAAWLVWSGLAALVWLDSKNKEMKAGLMGEKDSKI